MPDLTLTAALVCVVIKKESTWAQEPSALIKILMVAPAHAVGCEM